MPKIDEIYRTNDTRPGRPQRTVRVKVVNEDAVLVVNTTTGRRTEVAPRFFGHKGVKGYTLVSEPQGTRHPIDLGKTPPLAVSREEENEEERQDEEEQDAAEDEDAEDEDAEAT